MEPITREEAFEFLERAPVAHLGMIDGDEPYVTPMSFVIAGDRIYFRTVAGRKLAALETNPAVCVEASSFDEETGDWMSVIATGTAAEADEATVGADVISRLFDKYQTVIGPPLSRGGGAGPVQGPPHILVVEIEEISGMASGRGWSRRTRPGRL